MANMAKDLNRLRAVLAEKKIAHYKLAKALGVGEAAVSKWCSNTNQPNIETFIKISRLLAVDINDLIQHDAVEIKSCLVK